MKEASKSNIRYVGFESLADGARRLDYAITAPGVPVRCASVHVPATAFSGTGRMTFQESATICFEKIRSELESQVESEDSIRGADTSPAGPNLAQVTLTLTVDDIERFRPRRRAAGKRL